MSTPTIPEPIATFFANVNSHDKDAFLAAFTADGVVDDWGRTFTGPSEIEAWSDNEFIGSRGTLTVEEVQDDSGTITVIGDWRSNHANGRSAFTFVTDGGLIAKMSIREG